MAMNIKKLFATDASRSSAMLLGGVLSLAAAALIAGFVWRRWGELGVRIGPNGWIALIVVSLLSFALAAAVGIGALIHVNKLEGSSAFKCIVGFLLSAVAVGLLIGFLLIAHSLAAAA